MPLKGRTRPLKSTATTPSSLTRLLHFQHAAPSLRLSLAVLLFFSLLYFALTYPLVFDFSHSFISPEANGDSPVFIWNAFVVRDALINQQSLLHTDWQVFPLGGSMVMHSHTAIIGLFNLLFNNPILASNVVLYLSFVLSAWGAYRLSYLLFGSIQGALLCGFVFAFSPYKLVHLTEHFNLMLTASIPFYILTFHAAFGFEKRRFLPRILSFKAFGGCIALGVLSLLSDYYTTFFLLYFSAFALLFMYFLQGRKVVFSIQSLLIFTLIIIVSHSLIQVAKLFADDKGAFWLGGNLLSFALPHANSLWWGSASLQAFKDSFLAHQGSLEYDMFLGWSLLLVLIIGLLKYAGKDWHFLGLSVLLYFMLCMPALKVHNLFILNLPTSVLHFIPFFNHVHVPPRNVLLLGLFIPLLIQHLYRNSQVPRFFYVLLLLLSILEFWPKPYSRLGTADVPDWVYALQKNDSVMLHIPEKTGLRDGIKGWGQFNSNELFYQTIHRKKLVGGYFSRLPESTFVFYRDSLGIDSQGRVKDLQKLEEILLNKTPM